MYLIFFQTEFREHYLFNEQYINMFLCLHLSSSKCLEAYFGTNLRICLQCSSYCVSLNCKTVDPSASHHTVKPSLTDFLFSVSAWKLHFWCITLVTCAWQTCLCITLLLLYGCKSPPVHSGFVFLPVKSEKDSQEISNYELLIQKGPIYSFRFMF